MIREIDSDKNKQLILNYIGKNYYQCLYLYIDLTYYSLDNNEIKCWALYNKSSITLSILQYHKAIHLYSKKMDFDIDELMQLLRGLSYSIICGKADLINLLSEHLPTFTAEIGHVARLYNIESIKGDSIELASEDDIEEIANLVYADEDSGASYDLNDLIAQMKERLKTGFSRNFIIREDNLIVANVSTGGETSKVATLNNVIVRKEYRRRGLAMRTYRSICRKLLSEGKEVYSIFYVPESIALHNKLGFVECCKYGKLFARTH